MRLHIEQIVLDGMRFAHRAPPPAPDDQTGRVQVQIQLAKSEANPNTVRARLIATSEGSPYDFEVTYAARMKVETDEGEETPPDLDRRLGATAGLVLFPYVRELVSNVTGRGLRGPTWLAPTDFNALQERQPDERTD